MSAQLHEWRGRFGRAYTRRNIVDWRDRFVGFYEMTGHLGLNSILEVGCNRGHNLHALQAVYPHATVRGIEPQRYARRLARRDGLQVDVGDVYDTRHATNAFDLVVTCGVLVHVPPVRRQEALRELARVSRRFLLTIDYFAHTDAPVAYRGKRDMLWKADYGAHYLNAVPGLTVVRTGDLDENFDRSRYWLLQKP